MELVVTEEHRALRATLRRFFAATSPSVEVRRLMATADGYDPAVWARMGGELGLQAMAIPEEYGGAGFGHRELAIVLEEMGRVLLCAPYLASAVLAAGALLTTGDETAKRDLLPGIAAGTTIATLAWVEDDGRWEPDRVATAASASVAAGGGWRLDGVKSFVLDGRIADLVLVAARAPAGLSLFAVDGRAPGLVRTGLPTLDQTRKLARLRFTGVPARLVGAEGGAGPALRATLDRAAVALAAEQLGGAQRVLDMSVEYAKVRRQFGRPIGAFQAVKHKCADMLVAVESARSAVMYASAVADDDPRELAAVAGPAKAYCSEAYREAAAENIQIHGGVGFTWEHDAHLYFKRATSARLLLGDPDHHRELLARRILGN
ncbi:acyl-CoA dehydrogenase family protein [Actinomadura sp. HBU206391]|uniref:acyl-CoA dehydrogenase family protein n=1 Tax=Actinomadura sp. HBU206391 TaxID=2731692 RepID=UPI001650AED6|nr:acyl-CoA dehydrogenase family protein [Actinomadura sp. HBU206391]MBC6463504.1 acyl-CoA dehydrogenase family protein [Actinomadura sp. HBU206391]